MAISLGFGIVFATSIILVIVPCLYIVLEDITTFIWSSGKSPSQATGKLTEAASTADL
jgi:hypothetical protein